MNAEGIPSGESMTIMHCESTRFQCRGCFVRLRRTQHDIYKCILHQSIFEMSSSEKRSYLGHYQSILLRQENQVEFGKRRRTGVDYKCTLEPISRTCHLMLLPKVAKGQDERAICSPCPKGIPSGSNPVSRSGTGAYGEAMPSAEGQTQDHF